MPALQFILTTAGKNAIINANNTGTNPIVIDRVAIGSASWTPTAAATALNTEIKKISAIGGGVVADDTIHVTATDATTAVYTVREVGLYTTGNVLLAIYSQADPIITKGAGTVALIAADLVITGIPADSVTVGDTTFDYPQATETVKGVAELATTAEAQAGTDDERIITPKKLQDVTATETRKGVVELATTAEAQAGSDDTRAITPAKLQDVTATITRKGVIEIATDAEVQTGTDTERAVTPAGLNACTATTTRSGVVELATSAEVQAGSDASRAVTAAGLATLFDLYGYPNAVLIADGVSVNSPTKSGLYRGGGGATNKPTLEGGSTSYNWQMIHIQGGTSDVALQILGVNSAQVFYRTKEAGTWEAWQQITFNGRDATTTRSGVIELATNAEVQAGTDTERAVTPAGLNACTATTSRTGVIELATQAEVDAGSDGTRAVTPNSLRLYPGTARAWVNFDGDGAIVINSSHGVSSVTDLGVGLYQINWDGVFGSSNYAWIGTARASTDGASDHAVLSALASQTKSTSALRIRVSFDDGGVQDSPEISVVAFA